MFHFTRILRTISHSVKRAMSSAVKPTVIFVLGGPGAGKGTQCEKIVKVSPDIPSSPLNLPADVAL